MTCKRHHIISLFIVFFCCWGPLSIFAQKKQKKNNEAFTSRRSMLEPIPVHLSGVKGVTINGFKLGIDYPIKMTEYRGFKGSLLGQRQVIEQYISADVGDLHVDKNYENLFFSVEWTVRYINGNGYFFQITPISVAANYLIDPVYSLFKSVKTDTGFTTGKIYVTPSVSAGFGRDFAFRRGSRNAPITLLLRGNFSAMYPYKKNEFYFYPTVEASIAYRFSRFNTIVKKTRQN
jgi:hypothetical protein